MTGACSHDAHHCTTCADEALPMWVVERGPEHGLAVCEDSDGHRADILIGLIDGVALGDRLLVHAGAALSRLPPEPREAS